MRHVSYALLLLLMCSLFATVPMGTVPAATDAEMVAGDTGPPSQDRALASSQWPMFHGDAKHTGLSPYDASGNPGKVRWWVGTTQPVLSSPAIGPDGTIYIGSDDNSINAINADGTMKWKFTTDYSVRSTPAIDSEGNIYFGSFDDYVYSFYPNGTERWRTMTHNWVDSSPTIGPDGTVYIGTYAGALLALNPNNGIAKWSYSLTYIVSSSPALANDGTVYVGVLDSYLYSINSTGGLNWRYPTGGWVSSSPAIGGDGTVYFGCNDNKLYAVNPDGSSKWNYTTGDKVTSSPAIGPDGTIYVGSLDDKVHAVNPSGSGKWQFTTGGDVTSSPAVDSQGNIFFGSVDKNLYSLYPNGTLHWKFLTAGEVHSSPAIGVNGTIFFGSNDRNVYAIGKVAPSIARNVTAISGPGFVNVSWKAPADDGGSPLTGYEFYKHIGTNPAQLLATLGQDVLWLNDTTVTNGEVYSYHLKSINVIGRSSATEDAIGMPGAPTSAPSNLIATAGDGFVQLDWTTPDYGGGGTISKYKVYKKDPSTDFIFFKDVTAPANSYYDTAVSNGLEYHYRVTAVNNFGESNVSNEVDATPMRISTAPKNVTTGAGHGFVVVVWDVPDDPGGGQLLGYNVYRDNFLVNATDRDNGTYRDEDVVAGEKYCYEVSALNLAGESKKSDFVCVIPQWPPSAPQNVTIETNEETITISWDQPEDAGGSEILRYVVYRGCAPGSVDANFSSVTNSYEDRKVKDGQKYYYSVAAVNEISEGETSTVTEILVTFPVPERPDLSIGSITLTHENGTGANDDILEGETVTMTVTVKNIGTKKNVATTLKVMANGTTIGTPLPVTGIDPDTVMVFVLNWTPTKGSYNVSARIDPDGKVTEMDEENNLASITVVVNEKGGGGGGDDGSGGKKKTPGFEPVVMFAAVVSALVLLGVMRRRR